MNKSTLLLAILLIVVNLGYSQVFPLLQNGDTLKTDYGFFWRSDTIVDHLGNNLTIYTFQDRITEKAISGSFFYLQENLFFLSKSKIENGCDSAVCILCLDEKKEYSGFFRSEYFCEEACVFVFSYTSELIDSFSVNNDTYYLSEIGAFNESVPIPGRLSTFRIILSRNYGVIKFDSEDQFILDCM